MKLIIDIPEEVYNRCNEYKLQCGEAEVLESAVAKGNPLPKGHGRLIDADALHNKVICTDRYFMIKFDIEEAPTIIEADEEEQI